MYRYIKRVMDMIGASVLLIVFCLPLIIIAGVLAITQKKVLFTQQRVGAAEKIFLIYKFQTMTSDKNKQGELLPDEERLTKFGSFLRKMSLDELPQLVNILKGDMSFIGPRPLLVSYLPLYNNVERKRHIEKPGLTGLAQVNGRNNISWKEKFRWDVLYIERLSFLQDLEIFLLTIKKVIGREDVSQQGHATTLPFEGHHLK